MLTKGAVEDIIMRHLRQSSAAAAFVPKKVPELKHRVFLSDWELRRLYTPGSKSVKIPATAIVSPLSLDWLDYNGISVLRD